MAKRSPILGYNHNVRYRGLIFHVQTEDSGLQSPHLFTHLFHGGVIVSTRKLVYDAGSAEEAIKALMQAQHKAVLKDLKKGSFDDKIDLYLGQDPELLPRGSADAAEVADAPVRDSEPVLAVPAARTQTAERGSAPTQVKTALPPPLPEDPAALAVAMAASNATIRNVVPPSLDSGPELFLQLNLDDSDEHEVPDVSRSRTKHDTEVQLPERGPALSDGVPGSQGDSASTRTRRTPESVPPLPPPPIRSTGDRVSAVGAASLPPARPITRPPSRPAIVPPAVVSRPLADDPNRKRHESEAVEIYAPAPPSVEAPPGVVERPGQYSQFKRVSERFPVEPAKGTRDRTGSIPIPSGLARPGRPSVSPGVPRPLGREPSSGSLRPPVQGARPPERPRTPTPPRMSPGPAPAFSRTSTPTSGVVMTRPAVIVGAPAKPATPPRVRKAREEEGRGFGQGLISEKSLDEVILAYLSEDADDNK